jgi:hypothetical protein
MPYQFPFYPLTQLPHHHPTGLYSLQLMPRGDKVHVPFRLNELKKLKKDLGNYTENLVSTSRHSEKSAKILN